LSGLKFLPPTLAASIKADFPERLHGLFDPARYKVLYGGRGGAKSWGVARALLLIGAERPVRVLCAREIQGSIRDSVHRLLSEQAQALGLAAVYEVLSDTIRGPHGTEFLFAGLKHNVSAIKSKEGVDICWVEEAQTVAKTSWDTLIPTIRKPGSEIWVTFNPELEEDDTYQRFVVRPPDGAWVQKVDWKDNPWFPDVLRAEKDALYARDPDAALHVWEGHCRQVLEGAVYAAELRAAATEGRIRRVPYDPARPVHTFWDLGWSDSVAIWMAQGVGLEFRVVDYLASNLKPIGWYVAELQKRPYAWGEDWLPHDAQARTLAAEGRTIEGQLRGLGRRVRIAPRLSLADGINAARGVMGRCWFDQEKCADGLQALRHYRYELEPETGRFSLKPRRDWATHGADAFRYLALAMRGANGEVKRVRPAAAVAGPQGWMG
jgi:phage terminase large subunit